MTYIVKGKYRISVIMGLYNCAPTLPEALDSLLAQTYSSYKVIMCDDGSTDSTYSIAHQYANKYCNFILIKNAQNRGLNYTLNHCLKYADTEFVARMDGDDISLPTRFEKEIAVLDNQPFIAIVSSNMFYFDEGGIFRTSKTKEYPQKWDFIKGSPFCHAPCMIRKEAYDVVGGYSVDDRLLRVEDYHLWFKMYAKGFRGFNITEPLYMMRDDRNALRRRKFKFRLNESRVIYYGLKELRLPIFYRLYSIIPVLKGILPFKVYRFFRSLKND